MNNEDVDFLVDTGANITAISDEVSKRINAQVKNESVTAITADSSSAPIVGLATIHLQLGDHIAKTDVLVVPNLARDCLLGHDVLSTNPHTQPLIQQLSDKIDALSEASARQENEEKPRRDSNSIFIISTSNYPQEDPSEDEYEPLDAQEASINELEESESLDIQEQTEEEAAAAEYLKNECEKISASTMNELTRTDSIRHVIRVKTNQPIRQKIRPIPFNKRAEFRSMVDEMLEARIIVPSNSEWRSPTNLVAKKDGSTRITLDYRKLNEVTEKDAYPLPNINSSLSQLAGANYFTKLDLSSGYYQVPMEPESQKYTAFGCEFGLFEYTVMLMGLTNATATFQRLMNYVLSGLIGEICMVDLDDIIFFTKGPLKQHIYEVLIVAHRIRDHKLRLKLKKCEFVRRRIELLGHTILNGMLTPNKDKIETDIRSQSPLPKCLDRS
jgi:predicted aspartyl protease